MITGKFTPQKTPAAFAAALPPRARDHVRYAAFDFGESCGLAFCDLRPGEVIKDVTVYLDLLSLAIGAFDSTGLRFLRLEQFLDVLAPDVIGFENVKYTPPQDLFIGKLSPAAILARTATPTEFFGALKSFLVTYAERRGIPAKGYEIAEIKKYATGKGNASKVVMTAACNARLGTDFDAATCEQTGADDMADAAFALCLLVEQYRPSV